MSIGWSLLLGAALEAGLSLLVEVGVGDEARALKERLTKRTEKARQAALDRAIEQATTAAREQRLLPLLDHPPFREAVVTGLLDPVQGFDPQVTMAEWEGRLPSAYFPGLRRFFSALETALLADETWGPILERYQDLRFRQDVLAALKERKLDVPPQQLVSTLNAELIGSGVIAQDGSVAASTGGLAVGRDVVGDIVHTYIQQLLIERIEVTVTTGSDPDSLRRRYLAELAAETNRLPWASLDPDYADPGRGESLGLIDVYTALDTTELERVESEDELRVYLARQAEARRVSAQSTIDGQQHLILLGDPGSGKSTLVNFVTYVLAQAGRAEAPATWLKRLEQTGPWRHGALLPVRVVLRDLAARLPEDTRRGQASLLLSYLRRTLETWGLDDFWPHLQAMLREPERPLLILLDGLDEVPASQRRVVVETVNDVASRYPDHRYLVTCRIYAYVGQSPQLRGFHQATLAPFSQEQMAHFIAAWYGELARRGRFTRAQSEARAEQLQTAVARPDLRGLAERPLLLTVMALLHTFRGQLPEDRVELYRWTVDLLLRRWEGRVGDEQGVLEALDVPGLKMSDLEAGLYEIAFRAHGGQSEEEGTADVAEADLRSWLAPYLEGSWDRAGQFIAYVRERAGLLIRHKPAAYTFPHRTFQEFMAACHLVGIADYPAKAARLVKEEPERWREVFILAAGHAARTHRLGQGIAAVNALCPQEVERVARPDAAVFRRAEMAGEALLEIGLVGVRREETGRAALQRVQGWLVAALGADEGLEARERAAAGNTLARLGDPRFQADGWYLPDERLLGFVKVPAGPFRMGTKEKDIPALLRQFGGNREWYEWEVPQHEVALPTYYIARYPVTVAQFRAFVEASGYEPRDPNSLQGQPNHPVVWVTWYDALEYCRWLTEQLRDWESTPEPLARLLGDQDWEVRLPTEAEWEKAARGTDGRLFPWGDRPDPDRANYGDTGIGTTSAAGCFPGGASPYGVLDLSGNVWEWCHSLYKSYPYRSNDGREDPKAEGPRVLRGGAFGLDARFVRCAYRNWYLPAYGNDIVGCRVVVAPGFHSGL